MILSRSLTVKIDREWEYHKFDRSVPRSFLIISLPKMCLYSVILGFGSMVNSVRSRALILEGIQS